jgi:hypothetical protein
LCGCSNPYGGLGKNFTFRLAVPDQLVTTGIHSYVLTANFILLTQWDASVGRWMPWHWIESLEGWRWLMYCLLPVAMVWGISIRVRDEKAMLKVRKRMGAMASTDEEVHSRDVLRLYGGKLALFGVLRMRSFGRIDLVLGCNFV